MNRGTALRVVFAAVLLVAPLAPVLALTTPAPETRHVGDSPGTGAQFDRLFGDGARPTPVDREVLVTVKLHGEESLSTESLELRQKRYIQDGSPHVEGYVALSDVRDLSSNPAVEVVRMRQRHRGPSGQVAAGVARVGADSVHDRGLTGDDVTVGIIDGGFRVSDPELAGHVAAHRSFGAAGDADHGTAVASVVADTAPDADIHVAAVGDTTTAAEYREAVTWLRASGVDVIVDAGSYFGHTDAGTGSLSSVARNASGDVLFVTSAGNYAQRHWAGNHVPDGGRWVAFAPGAEGNALADGEVFAGRVRASLQWTPVDGNGTTADYELYLFRRGIGGPRVVASASPDGNDSAVYLDTTVPRGRYYLAVEADDVPGPHRLELFATRDLAHRTPAGSLAVPASSRGVLAVGAYDYGTDSIAEFSSRGPVDNRTGVDLVAPDAVAAPGTGAAGGTSFAAPYVAGTAALVLDAHPNATAAQLRDVLERSARDVGAPGRDDATGAGLLDARTAATLADSRFVLATGANRTTTATPVPEGTAEPTPAPTPS
ncbi:S8 family serine peptidase [Haloglomus litoreum]|uniref:S8 family serine peptidase n=1 Tax=Haloglomus litoreum TaxID=3034026 RepID=UPI0023E84BC0|nr:S8 family serine peptidase [Haloglomus sp. DT116]